MVSPIDGTITNLATWTVGGIVKPGGTLMNVVPLSVTPEIEAQVLNKDIGFVLPGQKVSVKFDTFPFTRYGTIGGRVVDISRDANKDDKLGLVYPVRVQLDAADIDIDSKHVTIKPGMAVSAEIVTGNRRVADYVFSDTDTTQEGSDSAMDGGARGFGGPLGLPWRWAPRSSLLRAEKWRATVFIVRRGAGSSFAASTTSRSGRPRHRLSLE
ncbi:MAG: HlyD family efflux transporter periplasmic adaptor subunit [Proteobacteria bacterium]|nr:HlyD family efflux transporter periplasmic adaptor subunit [Pseudomonadota bacterium]